MLEMAIGAPPRLARGFDDDLLLRRIPGLERGDVGDRQRQPRAVLIEQTRELREALLEQLGDARPPAVLQLDVAQLALDRLDQLSELDELPVDVDEALDVEPV